MSSWLLVLPKPNVTKYYPAGELPQPSRLRYQHVLPSELSLLLSQYYYENDVMTESVFSVFT